MKSTLAVLFALLAAAAAPVLAQDPLAPLREAYDFDAWPGRDGPSRQGLDLAGADLAPYEAVQVRTRFLQDPPEKTVRFGLRAGPDAPPRPLFEAALTVLDTPSQAQEALLAFLGRCAARLPRAGTVGAAVGDVAFAGAGAAGVDALVFTRANVLLRVQRMPQPVGSAEPAADIVTQARRLDDAVRASEAAADAASLWRPRVRVEPVASPVRAGEEMELRVIVEDPAGGKTDLFFEEGRARITERDGRWFFLALEPGVFKVRIHAAGRRFLVGTTELNLRAD